MLIVMNFVKKKNFSKFGRNIRFIHRIQCHYIHWNFLLLLYKILFKLSPLKESCCFFFFGWDNGRQSCKIWKRLSWYVKSKWIHMISVTQNNSKLNLQNYFIWFVFIAKFLFYFSESLFYYRRYFTYIWMAQNEIDHFLTGSQRNNITNEFTKTQHEIWFP